MQVKSTAEQLFFTTVRIETETNQGLGAGTGFFFQYAAGEERYLFIVTNKHVVRGANRGGMLFTTREDDQPTLGNRFTLTIENFEQSWFSHPDDEIDIAIMPLVPILNEISKINKQVFFKTITNDLVIDSSRLAELDAIEEVLFIGYPSGIFDTANLTPIARRGITATPIALDYDGKKMFLIDASVFPGSSGSPVFIFNTGGYASKDGGFVVGSRLLFIGVVSSVVFREDTGRIEFREIPTRNIPIIRTRQMIDLGLVFKAETVLETIEAFLKAHGY